MVCNEEKLLVNILYRLESEALKDIDLINIDFEKLIKIASSHLMLPAFFFNIQKKNLNHLFPDDFIDYIKNIYSINKARNEVLLNEVKELSELLYKNKINHIFLKGTALLLSDVFEDIGERMIGDIDFIIQHIDEGKVRDLLHKNNYYSDSPFLFKLLYNKHLPRQINKNKTIAIEPHTELLSTGNRYIFNSTRLIDDFKKKTKAIKIPSKSFLFDHCIYALQLEDKGFFSSCHSHRSIYDIYKLNSKNSLTTKNIKKDIYIKHFFITIDKLKIFDITITPTFFGSYYDKSFRTVKLLSLKVHIRIIQIVELFISSKYREYALNKIINFFYKKTS